MLLQSMVQEGSEVFLEKYTRSGVERGGINLMFSLIGTPCAGT